MLITNQWMDYPDYTACDEMSKFLHMTVGGLQGTRPALSHQNLSTHQLSSLLRLVHT